MPQAQRSERRGERTLQLTTVLFGKWLSAGATINAR